MNPTITLIKNAITVAREDYVLNRRPMSDDQRRAMFARGGSGGIHPPPAHHRPHRPRLDHDTYAVPAPPSATGFLPADDPGDLPRSSTVRKEQPRIALEENMPPPFMDPRYRRQIPGDPSGGKSFLPIPPRPGDDQIWPGGTPPWVFDPRIGGPNPNYPHPDNPNFGGPSIQPLPITPGTSGGLQPRNDSGQLSMPHHLQRQPTDMQFFRRQQARREALTRQRNR